MYFYGTKKQSLKTNFLELNYMGVDLLLGLQWGDEGKGKNCRCSYQESYDIIARFQGGPNAGHTLRI